MLGTNSEETGKLQEMEKAVPKGLKEVIMERVGHSPSLNPVLPEGRDLGMQHPKNRIPAWVSCLLQLTSEAYHRRSTEEGCVTPGPPTCDVVGPF